MPGNEDEAVSLFRATVLTAAERIPAGSGG